MFKVSYVSTVDGLKEARQIMDRIYRENPRHWPFGLSPEHFDGGLYLIREKQANTPIGFCGWQERYEMEDSRRNWKNAWEKLPEPQPTEAHQKVADLGEGINNWMRALGVNRIKVGYYSIGVLPEHRQNGFAKEALQKLIAVKSAGVNRVRALIVSSNKPSQALADALGVEKHIKKAHAHDSTDRTAEGTGAALGSAAAGGVLATGIGKSTPSFLDLAHRMYLGPSGPQLFEALAQTDPASATRLQEIATRWPALFKLALLGVPMPGVDPETHSKLLQYSFKIRPSGSELGDVLVSGPKEEITGPIGRLRHAVSGGAMHHTAIGLPKNQDEWLFSAGRNQGLQRWKGNLGDMGHASTVLRPKQPIDPAAMAEGVENAFSQPYSYGRLRRLAAQEILSTPWSKREAPTVLERGLGAAGKNINARQVLGIIPGVQRQLLQARMAGRCLAGHTCSTAVAEAVQRGAPGTFAGRSPMSVSPSDFLRGVGKDFEPVALNLPDELAARPQLMLNHLMKAGPAATRLLAASPFLAGAGYLGYEAAREPDLKEKMRQAFNRYLG